MLFLTILGWFAAVVLALLIGYSRGYVNGSRKHIEQAETATKLLTDYDKAANAFCEAIIRERDQYKLIAEAYARQESGESVNVKAVGKA